MTKLGVPLRGKVENVPISRLRLDTDNPRLADDGTGKSQEDLAVHLESSFDAFTVAESIAKFGYFNSEPLVAVPAPDGSTLTVVEGNRRLTALLGLAIPDLRRKFFDSDRWERLNPVAPLSTDTLIPVAIVATRDECLPMLGYRHISGILQWTPYAQARYINSLFAEGKPLEYITAQVGLPTARVASLNRDFAIVTQAKRMGIDTGGVENTFSLLQLAMSTANIRSHIGAPLGSQFVQGSEPIPTERQEAFQEVLEWIFGTLGPEPCPPVIQDSRQISKLGTVIAHDEGLRALRNGETLDAAKQRVEDQRVDPKERLLRRLTTAKNALAASGGDMPQFYDDQDVRSLIEEIADSLRSMQGPSA